MIWSSTKGHLISEWNFDVLNLPKSQLNSIQISALWDKASREILRLNIRDLLIFPILFTYYILYAYYILFA